ncbi:MAG TPA: AAA family ATPase [Candidatus Acidoferrales bacterium]|jgi:general secretion pathway protein A|nr:AAA family ATPase [Candidatus Acidoferrales bacterium]
MYKKFFGLKENPFNVNPDPRYLYLTPNTQEALACLTYGIETRKGFILLTGEVGTGKTTLINKLLEWLHKERVYTAFVFNPRLSVSQFFDFMMADFGIPCESHQKGQMLQKLNQWLLDRYQAGERAVLVVDEAQNLSPQMLEEIRLLTNLETSTEKLLQIVLAGQPELEQKLNQPQLRQLRQRITLRAKTRQLTLEETQGYIEERMRIAGADNPDIFSPEAVAAVHRYARGIPRVTNLLCEHALVGSFAIQKNPVPAEIVEEVARDFDLHIIDPLSRTAPPAPLLPVTAPNGTNGDQPPLIETLLTALNTLVDRLNQVEAQAHANSQAHAQNDLEVESDTEQKT